MTDTQMHASDALYRNRWLSLLSVDDLVEDFVAALTTAGAIDSTYFLFTSDHGFRFGQYRMPEGKWNTYDNDLRIPMVVRGPGIAANTVFDHLASNVDTMPTILGFAGVATPDSMDGKSLAQLLVTDVDAAPAPTRELLAAESKKQQDSWRNDLLVEYYGLGDVVRYEHLEDTGNNTFRTLRIIDPNGEAGLKNAKYVEFVNSSNWDHIGPALEFELFDLDADPWELKNVYSSATDKVKTDLNQRVDKLFRCRGTATCN
jgi:N-acetylglucosamine-6-sulfatase